MWCLLRWTSQLYPCIVQILASYVIGCILRFLVMIVGERDRTQHKEFRTIFSLFQAQKEDGKLKGKNYTVKQKKCYLDTTENMNKQLIILTIFLRGQAYRRMKKKRVT